MSLMYEELDFRPTPIGDLMLRRRRLIQLGELAQHLKPGGVFGLWADGFPEESFTNLLGRVFESAESHTIEFDNPLTGGSSEGAVYVARVSL